jgi:hypothetical protein
MDMERPAVVGGPAVPNVNTMEPRSAWYVPLVLACLTLGACASAHHRVGGFDPKPECVMVYDKYPDMPGSNAVVAADVSERACWHRAIEERADYDLLFVEFDDQGWMQGSHDPSQPKGRDQLDAFIQTMRRLYDENRTNGLSLAVYIHGWHHNADARDSNVGNFRRLLRDLSVVEGARKLGKPAEGSGPRVVGVYVGWRGESISVPPLNRLTFWSRKNAAERVAQGSVRELLARLDFVRDRGRTNLAFDAFRKTDQPGDGSRNVKMLTIGHSFGGLIAYSALSSEFLRAAVRSSDEDYTSRLGDLVIIVNPAIEGARYEPLLVAGRRIASLKPNQLPIVIVATSTADTATGVAFPAARMFSTLFERKPGAQADAATKTVGHNLRYTTHTLRVCNDTDAHCAEACPVSGTPMRPGVSETFTAPEAQLRAEYQLMSRIGARGFKEGGPEYLCSGLQLERTGSGMPAQNPFWVVETTEDVIKDHNDIFNPRFVSFIRQMYLSIISQRMKPLGK